jgi:hypothetical protein
MKLLRKENPEEIKQFEHIKPAPVWGPVRCFAPLAGTPRTCTLADGHSGPHVAHGMFKKVVAVWDSELDLRPAPESLAAAREGWDFLASEDGFPCNEALDAFGEASLRGWPRPDFLFATAICDLRAVDYDSACMRGEELEEVEPEDMRQRLLVALTSLANKPRQSALDLVSEDEGMVVSLVRGVLANCLGKWDLAFHDLHDMDRGGLPELIHDQLGIVAEASRHKIGVLLPMQEDWPSSEAPIVHVQTLPGFLIVLFMEEYVPELRALLGKPTSGTDDV